MDKDNRNGKKDLSSVEDTFVHKFGIKDNVVKGLGIVSVLGVIGFTAFKGYSKFQELERLKAELEEELQKK